VQVTANKEGPAGRGVIYRTAAYYLTFVVVGITTASFGPSLPAFARSTGAAIGQVSVLFTLHRAGYMVGSLTGGQLHDRLPGHLLTAATLLLIGAGLVFVSIVPELWLLLGIVFLFGLSQSTAEVGANTGIVRLHAGNVGPYMNGLHFSFGVGAFIAPIILTQALSRTGRLLPGFLILSAAAIVVSIWLFTFRSTGSRTAEAGKDSDWRPAEPLLVTGFAVILFLTIGGESSFGGWVFTYALQSKVAGEESAGYLTSLFWGALTVGRLLGIPVVHKLGPRILLVANFIGCAAAAALMVLWGGVAVILWTVAALLGLSMASIIPATFTLAGEHFTVSGRIAGIFVFSSAAGGMVLPWLVGQFFESAGPSFLSQVLLVNQSVALLAFVLVLIWTAARRSTAAGGAQ